MRTQFYKKIVYVIGNGQLSKMLFQAGYFLGIKIISISEKDKLKNFNYISNNNIITAEIENWKETKLINYLHKNNKFINYNILISLRDRLNQKKLFDKLKLPTATWKLLKSPLNWKKTFEKLGDTIIMKSRIGGYDGKNQYIINKDKEIELDNNYYNNFILEKKIKFAEELSIIGARNNKGRKVFYPITFNLHDSGILRCSIPYIHKRHNLQKQAEQMLGSLMKFTNYIGVMAMEFFLFENNLIVNEIAPRVHNSGHWTQNGSSISQFELHLRSILNLPIHTPKIYFSSIMINIIGHKIDIIFLKDPLLHIYWYNKKVKHNRKVGHINIISDKYNKIKKSLLILKEKLPLEYKKYLLWLIKKIKEIN
ncbi:purK [Wigglesworthia glossinidia endosymbiont of Glossina brevipalpis]|uniref:N5-carboxyaminoimidazole ribonucleotide synthase n=1 Tax=Wigglesworthia glossinidia brevipalpis TaxID=36870 RepID=Q8D2V6_WIGBR|nr:purK [Wigglesworthia glossinidia endosymbiont of Glossina brevipalpis]